MPLVPVVVRRKYACSIDHRLPSGYFIQKSILCRRHLFFAPCKGNVAAYLCPNRALGLRKQIHRDGSRVLLRQYSYMMKEAVWVESGGQLTDWPRFAQ